MLARCVVNINFQQSVCFTTFSEIVNERVVDNCSPFRGSPKMWTLRTYIKPETFQL